LMNSWAQAAEPPAVKTAGWTGTKSAGAD
jgi:hypothetical protein